MVDTIACVDVAIIAGLAIFAVATVYVIITPREQIERDMQIVGNAMDRALQANKPPYVSKRSLDKVDTMETLISDTNSGNRHPNLFDKCFKSVKNFIGCGSIVALGTYLGHKALTNGAHNEDEANSHYPLKLETFTPNPTSTPTFTTSPTSTPTFTASPTSTPTFISTPNASPRMPFLAPRRYIPQ